MSYVTYDGLIDAEPPSRLLVSVRMIVDEVEEFTTLMLVLYIRRHGGAQKFFPEGERAMTLGPKTNNRHMKAICRRARVNDRAIHGAKREYDTCVVMMKALGIF